MYGLPEYTLTAMLHREARVRDLVVVLGSYWLPTTSALHCVRVP